MLDQARGSEGSEGCGDGKMAVVGLRIGLGAQHRGNEIVDRKRAAGKRQLIENKAADRGQQQGLAGGRVEAHPTFVDFFPQNGRQPFEKGCAGDVLRCRQEQRLEEQAERGFRKPFICPACS